jgi:hypothetical protein
MRAALALVILVSSSAYAGDRVVVMAGDEMASALELSLASRHVSVTTSAAPAGGLRLDRAAAVQHAAMEGDAGAGVWIDANEVCVVSADGAYFRHTPLPVDATPRVFAAIATSLLDELIAPPSVNVDVQVNIGGPPGAAPAVVAPAAQIEQPAIAAAALPNDRWKHTLLEIGPTLSPASYGVEAELAFPLLPNLRVGVLGGVNQLYDGIRDDLNGTQMYDAAGEIRYIGQGEAHFDIGLAGGIMRGRTDNLDTDIGGFAAVRLSYSKEYAKTAVQFTVAPMVMFDFQGQGDEKALGIMTSLRLQVPI